MTVQDVTIAFGGAAFAFFTWFARECYLMLKESRNDIQAIKTKMENHEVRIDEVEDKLKIFRTT